MLLRDSEVSRYLLRNKQESEGIQSDSQAQRVTASSKAFICALSGEQDSNFQQHTYKRKKPEIDSPSK